MFRSPYCGNAGNVQTTWILCLYNSIGFSFGDLIFIRLYPDELNIPSWLYRKEQRLVDDPLQERCQDYSPAFPSAGGNVNFNTIETRFHLS